MQKKYFQQFIVSAAFLGFVSASFSQDTSMPVIRHKQYNTFSIGVNAGVLAPVSPFGGSNNFTKWQPDLGYGVYLKNQFTHYLAVQAEFLRGNLKGNNDNKLGNGDNTSNPYNDFKTNLDYAASLSAVLTFGNVNWLSDKNAVIPYVSAGAGIAGYKPILNDAGGSPIEYKPEGGHIHEFFVPVGAGLKIAAGNNLNIDLGFRANYLDGDNLDGYVNGYHKDKFSYGFAGLEFSFGHNPQLMMHNPVADFKRDLMDQNEALRASVASSQQETATEISSLKSEIADLKKDSDGDGVPDFLDKCPNTAAGTKVDGTGCPLPKPDTSVRQQTTTYVITEEDKRIVNEAIKDLQFDFGKATIRSSSYPSLDRVAQILVKKNFSLKLAGHTDNVGSDDANMKLSKDRAVAVKDYLVSKGANPSRIEATGYGETQPIASNKTAEGRQKNRRVEFTLF